MKTNTPPLDKCPKCQKFTRDLGTHVCTTWGPGTEKGPMRQTNTPVERRFCSWCGKVEHTKTCQDPELKKTTKELVDHIVEEKILESEEV